VTVRRIGWTLAIVAVLVRIVFWRHTGRVWEDSLITILHAENAVAGLGLTHVHPDEGPIHGFTSPLSVLIPLVGEWLADGWALETIRVASLVAAFFTVLVAARIAALLGLAAPLAAIACGYLAFEHHQVLWGMAGMETQVAICVLLLSIQCFLERRHVALGLALGLCMLARPDFAIWAAIVGVGLAREGWKARDFKPLATTVGIAMALWIPWVAFAWAYYGSPIPNTILAKAGGYPFWWKGDSGIGFYLAGSWYQMRVSMLPLLGPSYGGNGTGFIAMHGMGWVAFVMAAAILASLFAALTRRLPIGWLHAFFWAYLGYFLFLVPITFGWYLAQWMAVAIFLAAHGLGVVLGWVRAPGARPAWPVAAAYLLAMAAVLPRTFHGERNVQRMEDEVRAAVGRYLRDTSAPRAKVVGEPLGFIAYHSRRAYYDYPGLASRRVVEVLRAAPAKNVYEVAKGIEPDYLVLRDIERDAFPQYRGWLDATFRPDRRFQASDDTVGRMLFPERNIDRAFTVYRRKEGP
jgi:hypothetical protein